MSDLNKSLTMSSPSFGDTFIKYGKPTLVKPDSNSKSISLSPSKNNTTISYNSLHHESKLDELLKSIAPDRTWTTSSSSTSLTSDGQEEGKWIQSLSKEPSGVDDVINLTLQLNQALLNRKARINDTHQSNNICPIREELYTNCFNEIVRQVSIDNIEQGQLLLRTRNEMCMSIDAYKTLYQNSLTLNMKKEISLKLFLQDKENNIEAMATTFENQNIELENEILDLRNILETIEKTDLDRKLTDEKKFKEDLDFLKYQHHQLDIFLKQLNTMNNNNNAK